MIPIAAITEWRQTAPWSQSYQVEHDLLLSRILVEIFNDSLLSQKLAFRGGTALHKLFLKKFVRFSEDIDLVQIEAEPIGKVLSTLHDLLNSWLGTPKVKRNEGRVTMIYQTFSEEDNRPIKIKIEINTRDHFNCLGILDKYFEVKNRWFNGDTTIKTYHLEELMATKLKALYQRKKGRDLFDFYAVINEFSDMNLEKLLYCFNEYLLRSKIKISRAEFEMNLAKKQKSKIFNNDMKELISVEAENRYQPKKAYQYIFQLILAKLPGEPWKGFDDDR